jgi:hypothetical protein
MLRGMIELKVHLREVLREKGDENLRKSVIWIEDEREAILFQTSPVPFLSQTAPLITLMIVI